MTNPSDGFRQVINPGTDHPLEELVALTPALRGLRRRLPAGLT